MAEGPVGSGSAGQGTLTSPSPESATMTTKKFTKAPHHELSRLQETHTPGHRPAFSEAWS